MPYAKGRDRIAKIDDDSIATFLQSRLQRNGFSQCSLLTHDSSAQIGSAKVYTNGVICCQLHSSFKSGKIFVEKRTCTSQCNKHCNDMVTI